MDKMESEESQFSKVDHIGVVVRNLDKAIEYYQRLGIGPFKPYKGVADWKLYAARKLRGKPIDVDEIKCKVCGAKMGSIYLELCEPVEGQPVWGEFLKRKGEGVQHIAFLVDDAEREAAKVKEKGFEILYESRFGNGGGAVYFDTGEVGSMLVELVQWPPGGRF